MLQGMPLKLLVNRLRNFDEKNDANDNKAMSKSGDDLTHNGQRY